MAVDTWVLEPLPGDRFLVCSDGLFNEVPVPEIAAVLAAESRRRASGSGAGATGRTWAAVETTSPAWWST